MMNQPMGRSGRQATGRQTADKLKDRYSWLNSFSDYELAQISYCIRGEVMRSDESYFDISHPEKGVIQGADGVPVPEDSCYVPKSEVSGQLWEKLIASYS